MPTCACSGSNPSPCRAKPPGPDVTSGADFAVFTSSKGQLLVAPDTVRRLSGLDLPPLRERPVPSPRDGTWSTSASSSNFLAWKDKISHLVLLARRRRPVGPRASRARSRPPGARHRGRHRAPHRKLSPQPDRLRLPRLCRGAVHRPFRDRPRLRTAPPRLPHAARAGPVPPRADRRCCWPNSWSSPSWRGSSAWHSATSSPPPSCPTWRPPCAGLYGAEVPGTLGLRPVWWAAGLGIAVAGTLVAAGQSLWRLAHLPLLAPAQPRAWARASARTLRRQGGAGAVIAGGGGAASGHRPRSSGRFRGPCRAAAGCGAAPAAGAGRSDRCWAHTCRAA